MRAEQVFVVSDGAIENTLFFFFGGGGGGEALGEKTELFRVPSCTLERPRQRCLQQWQEPRVQPGN